MDSVNRCVFVYTDAASGAVAITSHTGYEEAPHFPARLLVVIVA